MPVHFNSPIARQFRSEKTSMPLETPLVLRGHLRLASLAVWSGKRASFSSLHPYPQAAVVDR